MKMYELHNVPIEYPEDFNYRHHYLEKVIHNILMELVANEVPINWVLGSPNEEKILDLIIESSKYRFSINVAYLNMLKAALVTHSEVNKSKLILLGLL